MLLGLHIQNLAIAKQLDLEFQPGMTVISGETGAGKSIIFDALGLLLGEKADAQMVRFGTDKAEVSASFQHGHKPSIQAFLQEQQLDCAPEDDLILRRVISAGGRSRAYINGRACPTSQLQWLAEQLLDIHGQHAHQSLLRTDTALHLLDDFGQSQGLRKEVQQLHRQWQQASQQLKQLQDRVQSQAAEVQLLDYQLQEFAQLAPQVGEFSELEAEQSLLANAEQILRVSDQVQQLAQDDEQMNLLQALAQIQHWLAKLQQDKLTPAIELFASAAIHLEEGLSSLQDFCGRLELDQERLAYTEQRLASLLDLARKHRVKPEQLPDYWQELQSQRQELIVSDQDLEQAEQALVQSEQQLSLALTKLSQVRQQAASQFDQLVGQQLRALDLPHAQFNTRLDAIHERSKQQQGAERATFYISMNPGQPAQPLNKVASGGELSRISLAIQVICAQHSVIPTLIFDEVDVGISGGTAEVVGQLLRQLGERGQVFCITHQAQVAAQGHQHLRVSKAVEAESTRSQVAHIDYEQRIEEIARMLGGLRLTEQTWAHAREMLNQAQQAH